MFDKRVCIVWGSGTRKESAKLLLGWCFMLMGCVLRQRFFEEGVGWRHLFSVLCSRIWEWLSYSGSSFENVWEFEAFVFYANFIQRIVKLTICDNVTAPYFYFPLGIGGNLRSFSAIKNVQLEDNGLSGICIWAKIFYWNRIFYGFLDVCEMFGRFRCFCSLNGSISSFLDYFWEILEMQGAYNSLFLEFILSFKIFWANSSFSLQITKYIQIPIYYNCIPSQILIFLSTYTLISAVKQILNQ